MMGLAPHQQRVVIEKQELDDRLRALTAFLNTETFPYTVKDVTERGRLLSQETAMKEYSEILADRIANFPTKKTPVETKDPIITMSDIDQFAYLLAKWHKEKVKVLEHVLDVPEETVLNLNGTEITLSGDVLAGFQAGLSVALMELGNLPFVVETTDTVTQ